MTRAGAGIAVAIALSLAWSPAAEARKRRPPKMEKADDAENADAEAESTEEASAGVSEDQPKARKRASEPEEPAEATPPTALELGVGGKALFRQLVWTADGDAAGLGPYSLSPGPQAGVWLEFYPGAFATDGIAANVGLFARYDYGFGVTSRTQAGGDVSTKYQGFVAGLKLRVPLGTFAPFGTLAYGNQSFRLTAEGTPADLPAVAYNFVHMGLGARIKFTPSISLDVAGAFLIVTDPGSEPGQVASPAFFPRAKAYGIEAGTSLYIHITSALGVRVGVDWRQYGLAFYPRSGDAASRMVTGAVDRYVVAWSGLEVALGRGGGELDAPDADAEAEAEAEPPPKRRGKKSRAADEEAE
jgi:hypothetical protein